MFVETALTREVAVDPSRAPRDPGLLTSLGRHGSQIQALLDAVRTSEGVTHRDVRGDVVSGATMGTPLDSYLDLVRFGSYAIAPGHISDLATAGWTEDAVFEITVAAALSESYRRLTGAVTALDQAGPHAP
jgi:hypothetical protein